MERRKMGLLNEAREILETGVQAQKKEGLKEALQKYFYKFTGKPTGQPIPGWCCGPGISC